jgi:YHS domain-containing protein
MWPFGGKSNKSRDPVCGMEVEESRAAAMSTYDGSTYYFCSKSCKEDFDRDPTKYLAKTGAGTAGHHGSHGCC